MIVISGALVLVALVLLVIGLIQPELGFVYASIAVSVAAFVFLIVGILQRRGQGGATTEPATAGVRARGATPVAPVPGPGGVRDVVGAVTRVPGRARSGDRDETPAVVPVPSLPPAPVEPTEPAVEQDVTPEQADALIGTVLVVEGRPRYHVDGCRYLAGKDAGELDVQEALAEGFSPCGVCRPDLALETLTAGDDRSAADDDEVETVLSRRTTGPAAARQTADTTPYVRVEPEAEPDPEPEEQPALPVPVPASRALPARKAGSRRTAPAALTPVDAPAPPRVQRAKVPATPVTAPARRAAPGRAAKAPVARITPVDPADPVAPATPVDPVTPAAPAKAGRAGAAPVKAAPTKAARTKAGLPVKAVPLKGIASPAASEPVAAVASKRVPVVVIPDRGRFHTADCRYVRGAQDALTISRSQAAKQGYQACGVCQP